VNYRSIADLAQCIRDNLGRFPGDVDLVVGIPRSGLLAASIIGLNLNLRVTDFESYVADTPLPGSNTRSLRGEQFNLPSAARHVLVVDDSINTGASLRRVRDRVSALHRSQKVTYCSVYASVAALQEVDICLESIGNLRSFEWNMLHRPMLDRCCLDIDGVLCADPTAAQNDDGDAYVAFLLNAAPLALPSYRVGHLVTSRLEKYRQHTETWLREHGVAYDALHMLDLPDAATRRRLASHASFKAGVYRQLSETVLFVESEPRQAAEIARISGKPALCFRTQQLYSPEMSVALAEQRARAFGRGLVRRVRRLVRRAAP